MFGAAGVVDHRYDRHSMPTLRTFQQILLHRGGPACNNMLVGPGLSGTGEDGMRGSHLATTCTPTEFFTRYNVYGERTAALKSGSISLAGQGLVRTDLLRVLSIFEHLGALACSSPLATVYLVTLTSDGMAIAPSLEMDQARLRLVGSTHGPLGLADLQEDATASAKCASLNSSMLEYHVLSLNTGDSDRQFEAPVACYSCPSGGGVAVSLARHKDVMRGLTACERCLKAAIQTGGEVTCNMSCPWKRCTLSVNDPGEICDRCKQAGVTSANPFKRPCASCILLLSTGKIEEGEQCVCRRLHPLFLASDCESREMSLMKWLTQSSDMLKIFATPDAVHLLKSVRSGLYWWWCIKDGHLVCLRLLMVLRRSADPHINQLMKQAVHAATLRNRDRMSFETVVELLSFALLDALPISAPTVVTLFPETWTKLTRDCPPTAVGMLWGTCAHPKGKVIFLSDVDKRAIFMLELHCPVRLTLVAGGGEAVMGSAGFGRRAGFGQPAGMALLLDMPLRLGVCDRGAFLFVADSSSGELRAIDVGPLFNQDTAVMAGDALIDGFYDQASEPTEGEATVRRNKLAHVSTVSLSCIDEHIALANPTALCDASVELTERERVQTHGRLYVTDTASGAIVRVDLYNPQSQDVNTGQRVTFEGKMKMLCKLPQGAKALALAYDARSALLLAADSGLNCIHVIHAVSGKTLPSVSMGGEVHGIAIRDRVGGDPDRRELLISIWPHTVATAEMSIRASTTQHGTRAATEVEPPALELGPLVPLLATEAGAHGMQHDDLARLATTVQPRAITCMGRSVLFIDHLKGVRLLTDVGPLRRTLKMFAPLVAAIGFMPGCEPFSWAEAEVLLKQLVQDLLEWEEEVRVRTGVQKPGAMNGPQGIISGSARLGFKMLERSIRQARAWALRTLGIDLDKTGVTLVRVLELVAERFFARMRAATDAVPTEHAYRGRRTHVIANLLRERFNSGGLHTFAGGSHLYPEPPGKCALLGTILDRLTQERDEGLERVAKLTPAARVREHDFLYEARTEQIGQKTRQLSVRSRTLDAPGTAPSEQAMPAPAAVGEASQALSSMLAHGLAGTARAGGGHARRPVLHLAHKATSCIAFLGDSPETQSSWQRGDVLRRVYLAMLEEDVHIIAGSAKWESRDCEVRWLVNADGDDPGLYRLQEPAQTSKALCNAIFAGVQLEELVGEEEEAGEAEGRADGQQRTWRLPDTEVTRLRHLGEEEAEEGVERQLIRDERSHAQRTYERGELQRESGGTAERATGKRTATVSAFQLEQQQRQRR